MLFLVAILALAVFGPAMQRDRIELTSEFFSLRTGGWWQPNEHRFLLRDVARIEVVTRRRLRSRSREFMRVTFNRGGYDDVPIGDLFRARRTEILQALTDESQRD